MCRVEGPPGSSTSTHSISGRWLYLVDLEQSKIVGRASSDFQTAVTAKFSHFEMRRDYRRKSMRDSIQKELALALLLLQHTLILSSQTLVPWSLS